MRIGSISQGKNKCDGCGATIRYAERYLIVKEKGGVENENGVIRHYCVRCAAEKKYVQTRTEKGERIVTFFKEIEKPVITKSEEELSEEKEARERSLKKSVNAEDEGGRTGKNE